MLAPSRSSWPHTAAKPACVQAPEAGSRGGGAGPLAGAGAGAGAPSTTDNGANGGGGDENRKRTILLSTYLCHSCLLGNIRITPTHTGTNI
ncbi:hypothetical protein PVAP13_2KG499900 [Panicum virgatum]|uniref:Uncharacterized protein n=1 Tax=Panicum virgatum TaxID=38727 RepID=A0A8T0WG42_PANVG|nr:hypothetical protein PVAP13_2KG499900 [Panicum virgatum]